MEGFISCGDLGRDLQSDPDDLAEDLGDAGYSVLKVHDANSGPKYLLGWYSTDLKNTGAGPPGRS